GNASGGPLLRRHKRIAIIPGRRKSLFDIPRADPANEIELRARLVIGARGTSPAERLLANHRARRLVVDVEIPGSVAQRQRCFANRTTICTEYSASQRVRRSLVDGLERLRPLLVRVDVRRNDGPEDLFAQQPVTRI